THRDDVLGLGHLLVEAQDGGRHLVRDGAADDHQVGLPRAGGKGDDAEADEVVTRHRRGDELDRAAGKTEVEDPEAVTPAPVEDEADRLRHDLLTRPDTLNLDVYTHVSTPFRHA